MNNQQQVQEQEQEEIYDPRKIYTKLDCSQLQELLKDQSKPKIIIKFSATWCKPCQFIKELCDKEFSELPKNILIADIDIDETMDLYGTLKRKRMVTGVPTLLMYDASEDHTIWHIPDDSVSGADTKEIKEFFKRCKI